MPDDAQNREVRVHTTAPMGLEQQSATDVGGLFQKEQLGIVYASTPAQIELLEDIEAILPRFAPYTTEQLPIIEIKISIENLRIELGSPNPRQETVKRSWAHMARFLQHAGSVISTVNGTYQLGKIVTDLLNRLLGLY